MSIKNIHGEIIINNKTTIDEERFISRFGKKLEESEYEELIEHQNCTPAWKKIFGKWKKEGIIN